MDIKLSLLKINRLEVYNECIYTKIRDYSELYNGEN